MAQRMVEMVPVVYQCLPYINEKVGPEVVAASFPLCFLLYFLFCPFCLLFATFWYSNCLCCHFLASKGFIWVGLGMFRVIWGWFLVYRGLAYVFFFLGLAIVFKGWS